MTPCSRRQYLRGCALAGAGGLAGCLSSFPEPDCADEELVHESDAPLGTDESWPTYQYDAANTGHSPNASGPRDGIELAWRYPGCHEAESGAVVHGGKAYAAGLALDGRTGTQQWGAWGDDPVTPTVTDGRLYAGGTLRARDPATGDEQWSRDGDGGWIATPTVVDGAVYAAAGPDHSTLYAVDSTDGENLWQFETGERITTMPAVYESIVYVVDRSDTIYALNADDGDERWSRPLEAGVRTASPVVSDGTVFLGSNDGRILALDLVNGSDVWTRDVGVEHVDTVATANETVFAAGEGGVVVALDATDGSRDWRAPTAASDFGTPAHADEVVYVGDDPSTGSALVYALDATDGTELWQFDTREVVFGDYPRTGIGDGLAVVDDVVYVPTSTGDLYALVEP